MAHDTKKEAQVIPEQTLNQLNQLVSALKYGTVTLVIQDGRIVQLEKHEKLRLV